MTSQYYLEWKLIYSIVVAGKNAKFAENVMEKLFGVNLLNGTYAGNPDTSVEAFQKTPLDQVRSWKSIESSCREARTGNYNKLAQCLSELIQDCPDLSTCEPQDLERFHGIGPKTSRFFILWTRPEAEYAALDVHVLRWMRLIGYDAPKATPQSSTRYKALEKHFIWEAHRRGVTPAKLDWAIWVEGAGHPERSAETLALIRPLEIQNEK